MAKNATIKANNSRGKAFDPTKLLDNNKQSYWATADDVHEAVLELDLKSNTTFDIISLQEYIPLGQRIEAFTVEIFENNAWKKIYQGESISAKRLIKLEREVTTSKLRLNVTKSPVCITLSELGLYKKTL